MKANTAPIIEPECQNDWQQGNRKCTWAAVVQKAEININNMAANKNRHLMYMQKMGDVNFKMLSQLNKSFC